MSTKKMYRPSPSLSGRDSILLRFTPRSANARSASMREPGASGSPQKTTEVLKKAVPWRDDRCSVATCLSASHMNLVSFSGWSSTPSSSTRQSFSSADSRVPSAAQGRSASATILTASAVLGVATTSACPRRSRRNRAHCAFA